jgi:hypothetical protein
MYLAIMLATHPFLRASPLFLVLLSPASGFGGCIDFVFISVTSAAAKVRARGLGCLRRKVWA